MCASSDTDDKKVTIYPAPPHKVVWEENGKAYEGILCGAVTDYCFVSNPSIVERLVGVESHGLVIAAIYDAARDAICLVNMRDLSIKGDSSKSEGNNST